MDKKIDRKEILDSIRFRYACKEFSTKKIPKEDINVILEAGLLAPSSFGLEHTRVVVITNENDKKALLPICYNQKQIESCSHLVVFNALVDEIRPPSAYIDLMIRRRSGKDENAYKSYKNIIEGSINSLSENDFIHWCLKQNYLSAQSMMDAAAALRIDSCPIEGFNKKKLEEFLNLDSRKISLIVAFGYRKNEQSQRLRISIDEFAKFL